MGSRASGSASTALRRLMTEYKQLTASGQSKLSKLSLFTYSADPLVFTGSPDGMFTAGAGRFCL